MFQENPEKIKPKLIYGHDNNETTAYAVNTSEKYSDYFW